MDMHHMVDVKVLLDRGTTGMFIDKKFAEGNRIAMRLLDKPIRVYNVDGMLNQDGSITHEVTLMLSHKGHPLKKLMITQKKKKWNAKMMKRWKMISIYEY